MEFFEDRTDDGYLDDFFRDEETVPPARQATGRETTVAETFLSGLEQSYREGSQGEEEPRFHFIGEHLSESVTMPVQRSERFPNTPTQDAEVLVRDLPGYVQERIGEGIARGTVDKTLSFLCDALENAAIIGDGGVSKLRKLSEKALDARSDREASERVGREAQAFVRTWRVAKNR